MLPCSSRNRVKAPVLMSSEGIFDASSGSEFLSYGRAGEIGIWVGDASLVFRDEVLIEAKLKGNRTSKSFFAVFSDRLIMVAVADTVDYFLGAITRRLWFVIEPMSARAAPIQVIIEAGLEDEPQAVVSPFVEDGYASGRVVLTQHYRVLDVLFDRITE